MATPGGEARESDVDEAEAVRAIPSPPQRVSPITFPHHDPSLAAPDASQPQEMRDAYRQCLFALRSDVQWLLDALRLQRKIVEQSYPSRYRNHRYASALLLWSRVYGAGVEALRLTAWGAYASTPPLLRASLEWLAAEQAVTGPEQQEYLRWLEDAFQPDAETGATAVGMGAFMAGQQLAGDVEVGAAYRAVAEMARPHFGVSALLSAAESNREKVSLHWGEQAFHLGWAQLLLGWEILVQERQVRLAVGRELFGVEQEDRDQFQMLQRSAVAILANPQRCRAEWVEREGQQRLLLHNFRRQPAGAPKRILL